MLRQCLTITVLTSSSNYINTNTTLGQCLWLCLHDRVIARVYLAYLMNVVQYFRLC